ncbi:MAG: TetR/AcrR family transcriptional regulator [Candidatus Fimivivens sp.]
MDLNFTGTKKEIFEAAVELFSEKTFEIVIIKDIGKKIGKQHGGIYNHFTSKQEILDTIYAFFIEHFFDRKLSLEELEPVLQTATLMEIIGKVNFEFEPELDTIMNQIYRIIQNRKYFDPQAQAICKDINEQSIGYAESIFTRAIEIGRFEPFDTRYLALLCLYNRQNTYSRWVLEQTREHYLALVQDENLIYENATKGIATL